MLSELSDEELNRRLGLTHVDNGWSYVYVVEAQRRKRFQDELKKS